MYRINLLHGCTFCTRFTSGLYFSTTAVHLRTHQEITPHEGHSEAPKAPNNDFQNPPPSLSGPQIISSVHSSLSHMQHRREHGEPRWESSHYALIGQHAAGGRADLLKLQSAMYVSIFTLLPTSHQNLLAEYSIYTSLQNL